MATTFSQTAIRARDALASATWISLMVETFAFVLFTMRRWAGRGPANAALARQGT